MAAPLLAAERYYKESLNRLKNLLDRQRDALDRAAALCTDAYPTGYQAAEMAGIKRGDSVVVFGAGPIGLFAAKSAWFMGAGRVLIVDHYDYRLEFAKRFAS